MKWEPRVISSVASKFRPQGDPFRSKRLWVMVLWIMALKISTAHDHSILRRFLFFVRRLKTAANILVRVTDGINGAIFVAISFCACLFVCPRASNRKPAMSFGGIMYTIGSYPDTFNLLYVLSYILYVNLNTYRQFHWEVDVTLVWCYKSSLFYYFLNAWSGIKIEST